MLFRVSTRKRFVCLVVAFLLMMGFNTYSYIVRFHKTENQKQVVLNEKAFKAFFLRLRTKNDFARFLARHHEKLRALGSEIVKKAFIYQNNLYIHLYSLTEKGLDHQENQRDLNLLYGLFNIEEASRDFYLNENSGVYNIEVRNNYVDHNGARLSSDIIERRHKSLKGDLTDIGDMIREDLRDKRIEIFNFIKESMVDTIKRVPLDEGYEPNPYLSRVEAIIPMNLLYILTNIRYDNTTDIIDLAESVRYGKNATLETLKSYLLIPPLYRRNVMYGDIDIFPRYVPIYIPGLLGLKWNWLLYQDIDIRTDFIDYIDQLHFKGHYMFSYEKSRIIRDRVKKINDDIRFNQIHFYLTDLTIGIAFPFMISLFAFIHLKTEIAFLFMFKNRIRELLFIFWLLPVSLMLFVKGGIMASYLFHLLSHGFGHRAYIALPLSISLLSAAIAFYPINRWCFSQFTGDSLNLYALHKGR